MVGINCLTDLYPPLSHIRLIPADNPNSNILTSKDISAPMSQLLPSTNFAPTQQAMEMVTQAGGSLILPKRSVPPKRIGDILVDQGWLSHEQLQRALSEGKATGTTVGSVVVKLGLVSEEQLGKALALQHGLPYLDTQGLELNPAVMSLLPEAFIKKHLVVPIVADLTAKRLVVAMAHPDNMPIMDQVAHLTGLRPYPKVSTHKELTDLLDQYFVKRGSAEEALAQLEENSLDKDSMFATESLTAELERDMAADDAPVVQLVNSVLMEAIECGASDVHIEPQKQLLLIRFRIDGILKEVKSIPKKFSAAVVSRIKVASGMDIAERRRPQDGRMKLAVGSQTVDMRVNSITVQFGEKIVIRLLRPNATTGGLEKLGLSPEESKRIRKMITAPNGIILVTGPTGSGKTTTLYSCLREINSPELNISTIEDPVEYPLSGINQTQVSHKAGLSFALCLRALLRQDPDVVMVGEIRDHETLEAAVHAALTGHLVFSTIHTNSAAKTVARLLEMGTEPYMVSTAVIGVLAQRLIRRLCPNCKQPRQATPEELEVMGMSNATEPVTLHDPVGCPQCGKTGYAGRVGLYEIMHLSRPIQELIDARSSIFAIQDQAIKEGMLTLAMDGKRKILQGLTSLKEVTRVLGSSLDS
jgi:type IV pilus assembly protein PilB